MSIITVHVIWLFHKITHHHKITVYGIFNFELLETKNGSSYNNHYFQFYVVKWFYKKKNYPSKLHSYNVLMVA